MSPRIKAAGGVLTLNTPWLTTDTRDSRTRKRAKASKRGLCYDPTEIIIWIHMSIGPSPTVLLGNDRCKKSRPHEYGSSWHRWPESRLSWIRQQRLCGELGTSSKPWAPSQASWLSLFRSRSPETAPNLGWSNSPRSHSESAGCEALPSKCKWQSRCLDCEAKKTLRYEIFPEAKKAGKTAFLSRGLRVGIANRRQTREQLAWVAHVLLRLAQLKSEVWSDEEFVFARRLPSSPAASYFRNSANSPIGPELRICAASQNDMGEGILFLKLWITGVARTTWLIDSCPYLVNAQTTPEDTTNTSWQRP